MRLVTLLGVTGTDDIIGVGFAVPTPALIAGLALGAIVRVHRVIGEVVKPTTTGELGRVAIGNKGIYPLLGLDICT